MTATELDRIEAELNLVVPRSYREFMQSGSFGEGEGGPQELTGVADEVIERTKLFRAKGFFGSKWPDNYMVIGDDGAGDLYLTDVEKERPAVQFADHEMTSVERRLVISDKEKYETFAEFWEYLEKMEEEVELAMERQNKKPWWRFWG